MDDGCGECDCREEDSWTAITSGSGTHPILEPAEHDLDPVAPLVSSLAMFDGCLSPRSDRGYRPVSLCLSTLLSTIPKTTEQKTQHSDWKAIFSISAHLGSCGCS